MPFFGAGTRVFGELAALDDEQLRRLSEQDGRSPPSAKALKEGWLLKCCSGDDWVFKVLNRAEIAVGGRRVYARLTADALALYEDVPGSRSGKGKQPTEVLFLSMVSAVLGRERGSDTLRCVHARGVWWEFKRCSEDKDESCLQDWGKCMASRLMYFKQAKRQSQRITVSTIARFKEVGQLDHRKLRKWLKWAHKWLPCCDSCLQPVVSADHFSLNRRFSSLKDQEPTPYRGDVEFHSDLVNVENLKEVSDPELQEAQGAHWSDQCIRYLRVCFMVPEELGPDFTQTLRMGSPDGLKRLIWPLASGEAVEPPRVASYSPDSSAVSSTCRDPDAYYKSLSSRAFGGVDPKSIQLRDPVPTFCQGIAGMQEAPPLKSVVKHIELLNQEGQRSLRRLLWVIQLTFHQVEFCPFLPNLMGTLLAFFTEAETMTIVMCILKQAEKERDPENAFNLRMVWNSAQLNKQAKAFLREGKGKPLTGQALRHLEKLGFDVHALAVELLQDGLASRLPFRAFCRLVGSFLREGSEVLLRYGLALLKLRSEKIVACTTKEEAKKELDTLGQGFTTFSSLESLTKAAFSRIIEDFTMTRLNSEWGSQYVAPKTSDYQRHMFCRPRLFAPRGHCTDEVWEEIWGWVPRACRIFDPHLVYTPSTHGTSMRTLFEIGKKSPDAPMFFFCYSKEGDVIGGYSPGIWSRTNGYMKPSQLRRPAEDSFVFRKLAGEAGNSTEVWPWSGKNEMLFNASELHGLIFGGQSAAISIGKDMTRCTTSPSATFNSPTLVVPQGLEHEGQVDDEPTKETSSIQLVGEMADFEMWAFEVFALL